MKRICFIGAIALATAFMVSACSSDEDISFVGKEGVKEICITPEFSARLSEQQIENIKSRGMAFLPDQQKDAYNAVIAKNLPARFGVYDMPSIKTRAVGIGGYYPAQYWTVIRLKKGHAVGSRDLANHIRRAINRAVQYMEANTNVRFYNTEGEINMGYDFELPNVVIGYDINKFEGTGSFGLVGGDQKISVPQAFDAEYYKSEEGQKELIGFLLHAFCNAAGMFNEQQRNDRDDSVIIYWDNIKDDYKTLFEKQSRNWEAIGYFDKNSVTLASSKAYSKNGRNTIELKGKQEIKKNLVLSDLDKLFLNDHYIPMKIRKDLYIELDTVMYRDNRKLAREEILQLQQQINEQRGLTGEPPISGRVYQDSERKWW